MKSDPARRDNTKYCEFHKDHGHRTDERIQLKKEIEYLIRRGHLSRYVASEGWDRVQPQPPRQPTPVQHQPPLGEIHVISRGFAGGGESSSARKAHLRNIRSREPESFQVQSHNEKDCWIKAMQEEMNSLWKNDTYELIELPKGRKAQKNKWVFKLKNDDEKLLKYKPHLMVKGFGQKQGINFDEIFSPVVNMCSI